MKLSIGNNIRTYRKKNDMTQEALADRLGVTYQSISRWENGTTYPDLELLPAISEVLAVTIDELLGMPQIEKEKRATEVFDELRRECMKGDFDADRIVELIRDIRRNHIRSDSAWRPWVEGNDRAFRDPKILPEVRLMAEAYLECHPMAPCVLQTMASIEDEEKLEDFLKKYTTALDCSERALLFNRYFNLRDAEHFEPERRYKLYQAFNTLLCPRYLRNWGENKETKDAADEFMETMLSIIRRDAIDDRPDMWVCDRCELELKSAARSVFAGNHDEAISKIDSVVRLIEETMKITEEVLLPTSCRFLDGMEWFALENWLNLHNDPDGHEERMIYIYTRMSGLEICTCLCPSAFIDILRGNDFDALRSRSDFDVLCKRIETLIVTRPREQ